MKGHFIQEHFDKWHIIKFNRQSNISNTAVFVNEHDLLPDYLVCHSKNENKYIRHNHTLSK